MDNAYHLLLLKYCLEVIASGTLLKQNNNDILQRAEIQIIRLQHSRFEIPTEIAAKEISKGQNKLVELLADKRHVLNVSQVFFILYKSCLK